MSSEEHVKNFCAAANCDRKVAKRCIADCSGDADKALLLYLRRKAADKSLRPAPKPKPAAAVVPVPELAPLRKSPAGGEEEEKRPAVREKPKIGPKPYTKHETPAAKATNWVEVPIGELVAFCKYEIQNDKTNSDDYVCPICQMEYYENMFTLSESELASHNADMVSGRVPITVVQFEKCANHFYHKECAEGLVAADSTSAKCAVCGHIYGTLVGTMPPGKMTHKVSKTAHCAGYEGCGTIVITYLIPSGQQNGLCYSGTVFASSRSRRNKAKCVSARQRGRTGDSAAAKDRV